MLGRDDEAVIQADAYIDALLARHGGVPVLLPAADDGPPADLRTTIDLLGLLPRFHPSFLFEETLAGRLRRAAATDAVASTALATEVPQLPIAVPLPALGGGVVIDRRLLVGGAIASGVSLAGAAMLVRAQRRGRGRSRREWLS